MPRTIGVFARFCIDHRLDPPDARELLARARCAFHAGVRDSNQGSEASQKGYDRATGGFETKAKELGFTVSWPGLWPLLHRDGSDVFLPDD